MFKKKRDNVAPNIRDRQKRKNEITKQNKKITSVFLLCY